jgi:hypothetical protein
MQRPPENPSSNRLPSGVGEDDLRAAILKSGYPLQSRVAAELDGTFGVIEEWGYIDRESKEARSLDLNAFKPVPIDPANVYQPAVSLLIECKRSELPFVFFEATVDKPPRNYPRILGLAPQRLRLLSSKGSLEVQPSEFLALGDLPLVSSGPPLSRSFSRVEHLGSRLDLSGQVVYRDIMLPLISAMHHWEQMGRISSEQKQYFPSITFAICVLDAPMVLVGGPPKKSLVSLRPWVRVLRQESFLNDNRVDYRHYSVDFVHADFMSSFVKEYVLPFTGEITTRLEKAKHLLARGEARVQDWQHFTWEELLRSP